MSEAVDTSEAEVERACRAAEAEPHFPGATLALVPLCRALLKERDEAQAEANAGRQAEHDADQERDEARARAERAEAERDESVASEAELMAACDALDAQIEEQRHIYHEAHIAMEAERDAARAEAARLHRGWLTTIQAENSCPATGGGCLAKRCGCVEEMKMLMREDDARAALAAKEPGHE